MTHLQVGCKRIMHSIVVARPDTHFKFGILKVRRWTHSIPDVNSCNYYFPSILAVCQGSFASLPIPLTGSMSPTPSIFPTDSTFLVVA